MLRSEWHLTFIFINDAVAMKARVFVTALFIKDSIIFISETGVDEKKVNGLDSYTPLSSSCSFATDTKLGWKNTAVSKGLAYFAGTWVR